MIPRPAAPTEAEKLFMCERYSANYTAKLQVIHHHLWCMAGSQARSGQEPLISSHCRGCLYRGGRPFPNRLGISFHVSLLFIFQHNQVNMSTSPGLIMSWDSVAS